MKRVTSRQCYQWLLSAVLFGTMAALTAASDNKVAPPRWETVDGGEVEGVPIKSRYNSEEQEQEFVFQLEGKPDIFVPCGEFNSETRRKIGNYIKKSRDDELRREAQARADAEEHQRKTDQRLKESQEAEAAGALKRANAELAPKVFRLTDGGTITGAKIIEHNEGIKRDMLQFMLQSTFEERDRYLEGVKHLEVIKNCLMHGDRPRLISSTTEILKYRPFCQNIIWLVEKTPLGGGVIMCHDGRALHWREAWRDACDAALAAAK